MSHTRACVTGMVGHAIKCALRHRAKIELLSCSQRTTVGKEDRPLCLLIDVGLLSFMCKTEKKEKKNPTKEYICIQNSQRVLNVLLSLKYPAVLHPKQCSTHESSFPQKKVHLRQKKMATQWLSFNQGDPDSIADHHILLFRFCIAFVQPGGMKAGVSAVRHTGLNSDSLENGWTQPTPTQQVATTENEVSFRFLHKKNAGFFIKRSNGCCRLCGCPGHLERSLVACRSSGLPSPTHHGS